MATLGINKTQYRRVTDRRTERQTDGIAIASTALAMRALRRAVKRTGEDRAVKKSQNGYISPVWGEAPTEAIYIKNCVVSDVLDVITRSKFQNEIFRGYDFIGGQIFHFPIDFWIGLTTVQRYCAACDSVSYSRTIWQKVYTTAVSYTHLTLPTILRV